MAKDIDSIFFDITPEIEELALKCETNNQIDKELYTKYEVKRGRRAYEYFRCLRFKDRRWKECSLRGKSVLSGI